MMKEALLLEEDKYKAFDENVRMLAEQSALHHASMSFNPKVAMTSVYKKRN